MVLPALTQVEVDLAGDQVLVGVGFAPTPALVDVDRTLVVLVERGKQVGQIFGGLGVLEVDRIHRSHPVDVLAGHRHVLVERVPTGADEERHHLAVEFVGGHVLVVGQELHLVPSLCVAIGVF